MITLIETTMKIETLKKELEKKMEIAENNAEVCLEGGDIMSHHHDAGRASAFKDILKLIVNAENPTGRIQQQMSEDD